jgi:hypothetical protein
MTHKFRFGKIAGEWWLNPKHVWTFIISVSGWDEEEDNGLMYLHGTIHILCLCISYTYWGWPIRRG